ncbi:MAG: AAA family ATPase, partial [Flavobacteriaceae bacterium]|nr:AAA family ATPase [Flavobacteriaceae bacterium]
MNNTKFVEICECLDKAIINNSGKIELQTQVGTSFSFLKLNNNSYRVKFHTENESYESITKENLQKFLFENWRGNTALNRDDGRITLFEAIGVYIKKNCDSSIMDFKTSSIPKMYKLNKILYGPPGTGKTYNTIDKALQIIDGEVPTNREEAKERFEVLKDAGQIEFVTFHQSYGYEEFVEGIKAKTTDGGIEYVIESGLFRQLVKKAKQKYQLLDILNNIDFNDYLSVNQEFKTKHGKKFKITNIDEDIYFNQGVGEHRAIGKTILQLLKDEEIMLNDEYYSSQVYIAREIYKQLNKKEEISKNYILIIDEINRGNISKIFGELITLIEDSKRLGEDEAVEITLPYSGDKFGVPNNLYILGTMNTADRSIALMDTALRRRFEFEEM